MPGAGEDDVKVMVEQIGKLLNINNQFYADAPISISVGVAICEKGETVESAVRRADKEMYRQKREYYASMPALDRRGRM